MDYDLVSLWLDDKPVAFRSAVISLRRDRLLWKWDGHVFGSDVVELEGESEMRGETTNGRVLAGRAFISELAVVSGNFRLQGTGSLTVDGQVPAD